MTSIQKPQISQYRLIQILIEINIMQLINIQNDNQ